MVFAGWDAQSGVNGAISRLPVNILKREQGPRIAALP